MRLQAIALVGAFAAALTLSACGNGGDEETSTESTASAPAESAAASAAASAAEPAMEAAPPAMEAAPPAMEAGAPAMEAEAMAAALTLDDIVGLWAETADACATNAMTIGPDAITVGDNACIVTGTEEGDAGLTVSLLCPVEGAEPEAATWTVTATGEAPFTAITITMGDVVTDFVACTTTE
jgi:hypothetical protein